MSDPEGRTCPECGAPRGPDHSPSCDCTERTAEALRETRTTEAAAAEDFDPLRIRPYVDARMPRQTAPEPGADPPPAPGAPASEVTATAADDRGPTGAGGTDAPETVTGPTGAGGTDAPETVTGPTGAGGTDAPETVTGPAARDRRSRRAVLLSVAAAGVAVVAAAGVGSGLLSYHAPSRDRAAEEVRQGVPDASTPGPASASAPVRPSAPRPPVHSSAPAAAPSPSAPPSPSPSPSASRGASGSASPTPSATTFSATPMATPAPGPVLRRGDKGPEVTELQWRLRQLNLYTDDIDGAFTRPVEIGVRTYQLARGITADESGTYGPATRASLEAETSPP